MTNTDIITAITEQGILPLYFHQDATASVHVLEALYDAGMRVVEYTNRGPEALRNFGVIRREAEANMPGMKLALGTVMDTPTARTAVSLGAHAIISPGWVDGMETFSSANELPWIPGCATATEIMRAMSAGIRMLKLFPASLLGPEFMRSIRDIFPDTLFMPTGGVALAKEGLSVWFGAGVAAVGMGSTLISKDILDGKDYRSLTAHARQALGMIKEIRSAGQ